MSQQDSAVHLVLGDEALLVERGTKGEVTQVGMHVDTNTPVYLVEFAGGCVVGCLEGEIALA